MGEPKVFISYSSKHYEEAKKLKEQLRNYRGGIETFLAKESLHPGERWKAKIGKAIEDCKVFVLMLNQDSADSPEVEREVSIADSEGKRIFVLRTDNCKIPSGLVYAIEPLQHFLAIPLEDKLFEAVESIVETLKQVEQIPDEQLSAPETKRRTFLQILLSTLKRLSWRWILEITGFVFLLIATLVGWRYIRRPVLPEYDPKILHETGQLILTFSRRGNMQNFGEGETHRPSWYSDREEIISVIIPENARSISKFAFADCTNLKTIEIKGKITKIGKRAFSNCTSLESVEFPDNLPDSLKVIDEYAFYACEALPAFDMPETLTSIGAHAFEGCHSLEEIDIPPLVTFIADSLFAGCKHLKEVNIFGHITEIGASAFYGTALEYCKVPKSVEKIGEKAFKSCEKLSEIEIPDSVTEIGDEAFIGCSNHATIRLPQTFLKNVGAFPYDSAIFTFQPMEPETQTPPEPVTEPDAASETETQAPPETVTEPEAETPPEPAA